MNTAGEIHAAIMAGLTLAGRKDGELQWLGTRQQYQKAAAYERTRKDAVLFLALLRL